MSECLAGSGDAELLDATRPVGSTEATFVRDHVDTPQNQPPLTLNSGEGTLGCLLLMSASSRNLLASESAPAHALNVVSQKMGIVAIS